MVSKIPSKTRGSQPSFPGTVTKRKSVDDDAAPTSKIPKTSPFSRSQWSEWSAKQKQNCQQSDTQPKHQEVSIENCKNTDTQTNFEENVYDRSDIGMYRALKAWVARNKERPSTQAFLNKLPKNMRQDFMAFRPT